MKLLEQIKSRWNKLLETIPDAAGEKAQRVKETGEENIKEIASILSNQYYDIKQLILLKQQISQLEQELKLHYTQLGKSAVKMSRWKKWDEDRLNEFRQELKKVRDVELKLQQKEIEYRELRKQRSDNYMVQKLSDEISEAGIIIDQCVVSEKSSVNGKKLMEIKLPHDVLIISIKRGENVIVPDGQTSLMAGDLVTLYGDNEVKNVVSLCENRFE